MPARVMESLLSQWREAERLLTTRTAISQDDRTALEEAIAELREIYFLLARGREFDDATLDRFRGSVIRTHELIAEVRRRARRERRRTRRPS